VPEGVGLPVRDLCRGQDASPPRVEGRALRAARLPGRGRHCRARVCRAAVRARTPARRPLQIQHGSGWPHEPAGSSARPAPPAHDDVREPRPPPRGRRGHLGCVRGAAGHRAAL